MKIEAFEVHFSISTTYTDAYAHSYTNIWMYTQHIKMYTSNEKDKAKPSQPSTLSQANLINIQRMCSVEYIRLRIQMVYFCHGNLLREICRVCLNLARVMFVHRTRKLFTN